MLELVEKGQFILNIISDRIEPVRYLDEFITIMNNISSSISEVRDDVEETVKQLRRRFQDCTMQYLKCRRGFCRI